MFAKPEPRRRVSGFPPISFHQQRDIDGQFVLVARSFFRSLVRGRERLGIFFDLSASRDGNDIGHADPDSHTNSDTDSNPDTHADSDAGSARSATHGGMGPIPYTGGVAFRVWAPNASSVAVAGDFNGWSGTATPLVSEGNGNWSRDVAGASIGQQYKYAIVNGGNTLWKKDPRAQHLTNSVGNSIIHDPNFNWTLTGSTETLFSDNFESTNAEPAVDCRRHGQLEGRTEHVIQGGRIARPDALAQRFGIVRDFPAHPADQRTGPDEPDADL
jgi:hypothetical protein